MRQFQLLTYPYSDFLATFMSNLPYTFLEGMIVKHYLYLLKLAAQMGTLTSSKKFFYRCYEFQNQNCDFKTTKTLILHAWSIFLKGAHLTKLWSKNIFHENPVEVRRCDGIYLVYFQSFYQGGVTTVICPVQTIPITTSTTTTPKTTATPSKNAYNLQ
jgi:hypothetical protein